MAAVKLDNINFSKIKTAIIGDERTEGYSHELKNVINVVTSKCYPNTSHMNILKMVEKDLIQYEPNLLILITMTSDLIVKCSTRKYIISQSSFYPGAAINLMQEFSAQWMNILPDLTIIWTLPDIPDLREYNKLKWHESQSNAFSNVTVTFLRNEEKLIFKKLKATKETFISNIKMKNTYLINLRSLIIDEEIEEKLLSYMTSHSHRVESYVDGVKPDTNCLKAKNVSYLFTEAVLKKLKDIKFTIKIISEKRNTPLSNNLSKYEGTLAGDIIQKLWDRHQRICDDYIKNPQNYPGHDLERGKYMEARAKEMAIKNIFPSAQELDDQWYNYWNDRIAKALKEAWERKRMDCVAMLNENTFKEKSKYKWYKSDRRTRESKYYDSDKDNDDDVIELKRKHKDIDEQASTSHTWKKQNYHHKDKYPRKETNSDSSVPQTSENIIPSLYNYLSSLLTSSHYLGKHYSTIKELVSNARHFKIQGLSETKLITRESLDIFKDVKCKLEMALLGNNHHNHIPFSDSIILKKNISTIKDLIEYCSFMLQFPCQTTSSSDDNHPSSSKISNSSSRRVDINSLDLNQDFIESLITKIGNYKDLSHSEKLELDQIIEDLHFRDKELAVSLSVIKRQSLG